MKKTHIIGIVVIAICAMTIITTAGDASSYVTFHDAQEMAKQGNNNLIHVVGQLKKNATGGVVGLVSSPDKLSVTFAMLDEQGTEQTVYYNEPMPADLVRAEKIVVIGSFQGRVFVIDQILLKCPSKYQEEGLASAFSSSALHV